MLELTWHFIEDYYIVYMIYYIDIGFCFLYCSSILGSNSENNERQMCCQLAALHQKDQQCYHKLEIFFKISCIVIFKYMVQYITMSYTCGLRFRNHFHLPFFLSIKRISIKSFLLYISDNLAYNVLYVFRN